jgi:hypothetical protein
MVMMCIGITSVSFIVGSLTSCLTTIDERKSLLKAKLGMLDRVKKENKEMDDDLYSRLRKALTFEFNNFNALKLLSKLPQKLQEEFSYVLHKEKVLQFPFFRNKPRKFVTHISPYLKLIKIFEGDYIYEEGDPADNVYFLVNGSAAFVLKHSEDIPFLRFEEGNKNKP